MRTIIEITEDQLQDLVQLCDEQNISRAEAIRRAISMYISETLDTKEDSVFGIWKSKKIVSLEYQTKMRNEWD